MSDASLGPDIIGTRGAPLVVEWSARDVMLYALAVGAGQLDPTQELQWTTENTADQTLRVLPSFAATLAQRVNAQPLAVNVDRRKLLHAAQEIHLTGPLPVEGRVNLSSEVIGLEFKRSGALLHRRTSAHEAATGELLFTATSSAFIRDAVGRGSHGTLPAPTAATPERAPDHSIAVPTLPQQALLFRLTGDRNRLHSDPGYARSAGFERPILHGLCTYGLTTRALLLACGEGAALRRMHARFARPVFPGDTLTVKAWRMTDGVAFQTCLATGEVVLDAGWLDLQPTSPDLPQ